MSPGNDLDNAEGEWWITWRYTILQISLRVSVKNMFKVPVVLYVVAKLAEVREIEWTSQNNEHWAYVREQRPINMQFKRPELHFNFA